MQYGPEYIIPKPFDRRVLIWEAADVAEAAVMEGVAAIKQRISTNKRTRSPWKQDSECLTRYERCIQPSQGQEEENRLP